MSPAAKTGALAELAGLDVKLEKAHAALGTVQRDRRAAADARRAHEEASYEARARVAAGLDVEDAVAKVEVGLDVEPAKAWEEREQVAQRAVELLEAARARLVRGRAGDLIGELTPTAEEAAARVRGAAVELLAAVDGWMSTREQVVAILTGALGGNAPGRDADDAVPRLGGLSRAHTGQLMGSVGDVEGLVDAAPPLPTTSDDGDDGGAATDWTVAA